jgi:hypothetical protein
MGSTTITCAVVALATGLACLVAGFLWGRSNLQSRVEQAVEEGAASLDTREFTMRQQLDKAMDEVARLRPLAEELERVQERLKREQSKYQRMKAEFDATLKSEAPEEVAEGEIEHQVPELTPESADEAIQRLLQSLETLNQPEPPPGVDEFEPAVALAPEPARAISESVQLAERTPAAEPTPVVKPSPVVESDSVFPQRRPAPQPTESLPAMQTPVKPVVSMAQTPVPAQQAPVQGDDEWQEFARSLAALTARKQ